MRKWLALGLLIVSIHPAYALKRFNYPYFKEIKDLHYQTRIKDSGKIIFNEDVHFFLLKDSDQEFFVTSAESRGSAVLGEEIIRKTISYYLVAGDSLTVYSHRAETFGPGEKYHFFELNYDCDKNTAQYTAGDQSKSSQKAINLSDDTFFARDTTILFPNLIMNRVKEKKIKLILPNGFVINLKATIIYDPEVFEINGKKITCSRVDLGPEFDVLFFIPKVSFWYLADPPYNFIRYEGPLAGPFSPTVVQELVY